MLAWPPCLLQTCPFLALFFPLFEIIVFLMHSSQTSRFDEGKVSSCLLQIASESAFSEPVLFILTFFSLIPCAQCRTWVGSGCLSYLVWFRDLMRERQGV